jgi:hypothetical protein
MYFNTYFNTLFHIARWRRLATRLQSGPNIEARITTEQGIISYLESDPKIFIASSLEVPQNSGSALKSVHTLGFPGSL